ncbi:hypothetical protein PoB_001063900 [Plakobranchus ocellatus]|uniref:Uncharacterized protein n=1 Tax=Plakobranchus ocellatus TaxID=259542 RepID=A0AAV3YM89_9GAST|nr:hypothetical protein PoB_001063900 [Plakobranchus ocellatus]
MDYISHLLWFNQLQLFHKSGLIPGEPSSSINVEYPRALANLALPKTRKIPGESDLNAFSFLAIPALP